MTDTEVKINGKLVGPIHQVTFYRFRYNISAFLNPQSENLLGVKVNKVSANQLVNEAERTTEFSVFGCIFHPMFLENQADSTCSYFLNRAIEGNGC